MAAARAVRAPRARRDCPHCLGCPASVLDDGERANTEIADSSRITQMLVSPERAPALKRDMEAALADPHTRAKLRSSLEHTLDTSRGLIGRWESS